MVKAERARPSVDPANTDTLERSACPAYGFADTSAGQRVYG